MKTKRTKEKGKPGLCPNVFREVPTGCSLTCGMWDCGEEAESKDGAEERKITLIRTCDGCGRWFDPEAEGDRDCLLCIGCKERKAYVSTV